MKSLTPKQRGEIYLKVAEILFERSGSKFLCANLRNVTLGNNSTKDFKDVTNLFPEFILFHPYTDNTCCVWFNYDFDLENNPREERIICMLLCYEMTKTKKL